MFALKVVRETCLNTKGRCSPANVRQFKPWLQNSDPQSKTPFECELDAYKLILQDEANQNNCPVVKAYGWFTLPENFERPGLDRDPPHPH